MKLIVGYSGSVRVYENSRIKIQTINSRPTQLAMEGYTADVYYLIGLFSGDPQTPVWIEVNFRNGAFINDTKYKIKTMLESPGKCCFTVYAQEYFLVKPEQSVLDSMEGFNSYAGFHGLKEVFRMTFNVID